MLLLRECLCFCAITVVFMDTCIDGKGRARGVLYADFEGLSLLTFYIPISH